MNYLACMSNYQRIGGVTMTTLVPFIHSLDITEKQNCVSQRNGDFINIIANRDIEEGASLSISRSD